MTTNTNSTETKPWYQSTTILGALATGLVALLGIFRINLGVSTGELTDALLALGTFAGTVVTIVGRIKASTTITK